MARIVWSAILLACILTAAGCSQPRLVDAAPYAADPECARVMLAVPQTVGGLDYRVTTSQATASWGDEFPIIARCGVEPPGPSPEPCVAIDAGTEPVDWLITETADAWVAVTFGRSPALEVTMAKVRVDEAVGDVLAQLSPAAAQAPRNGLECR